jgi:hypothetical protein
MNLKELIGRRKVVFLVFFILAAIAGGIVILIYTTKPNTNLKSAGVQANQLMAAVGGPAKVCNEASQMFKRFGVSKEKFLTSAELKDYPAIAALGTAQVILLGSPPHISIRVGTHRDGYFIEIADTNSPAQYPHSGNSIELVDSCVFVHR